MQKCSQCDYKATRVERVRKHMRKKHSEEETIENNDKLHTKIDKVKKIYLFDKVKDNTGSNFSNLPTTEPETRKVQVSVIIQPQTAVPTTVKDKPLIDRSPVASQNWTDFFIFNNSPDIMLNIECQICNVQFKARQNAKVQIFIGYIIEMQHGLFM